MAWTKARLAWICTECLVDGEEGLHQPGGHIIGNIDLKGNWSPHVDGITITSDDWAKDFFTVNRLVKIDLRKLHMHNGHAVKVQLTGSMLERVRARIGMK